MTEQSFDQAVVSSGEKADTVSQTRTVYDVGIWQIFWRNLVAGFARGLGMILVYIILLVIVGAVMVNLILPQLQPLLNTVSSSMNTLNTLNSLNPAQNQNNVPADPDLQNLLRGM